MENKIKWLIKILPIAIFAMASCSTPKDLVYKDFKNLSVDKMGFASSAIKMDLIYYNPNNFGLQLKRTELDIYINDNFLGHSSQILQISIPKRADFEMPLKVDVDMKNIFKNSFSSLFTDEVTVKVTGRITIGKANVFKSFPVNYEGKHNFSVF
ncbi:MAG: LEA type 2 family protein [Chitinophagaceae bacterium]|nr:LEA type 2 family protein [Chitinophagaceae bacterium]